MARKEVRVYGNQHGTWVEVTGSLARQVELARFLTGETPEEFLDSAIENWIKNHHPDYRRWIA